METLSAICLGLALATACGMRVFLPLLALSAGVKLGVVSPSEGFAWVGHTPVLIGLGCAATLEVLGYCIPWVDHALDTIATPLAAAAGTLAAATQLVGAEHIDPMLGWAGSVLGGGGLAMLTQGATVLTRTASTVTTAGLGNPVVAAAETTGALTLSVAAVALPIAGVLMVGVAGYLAWRGTWRGGGCGARRRTQMGRAQSSHEGAAITRLECSCLPRSGSVHGAVRCEA